MLRQFTFILPLLILIAPLLVSSAGQLDKEQSLIRQGYTRSIDSSSLETPCTGNFNGKILSKEQISEILTAHANWLKNPENPEGKKANLCNVVLIDLQLEKANLNKADLRNVHVSNCNFGGAHFSGADLRGAQFVMSNLEGAIFNAADLRGAGFSNSDLSYSYFQMSDLSEANFRKVELNNADFELAELNSLVYQPLTLPDIGTLISSRNLHRITYDKSPFALYQLREAFRNAGMRAQERQTTFAIKHNERLRKASVERVLEYFLFELTCQYGMSPGRTLLILSLLIPLFSIPYLLSMRQNSSSTIWGKKDDISEDKEVKPFRMTPDFFLPKIESIGFFKHHSLTSTYIRILSLSLYFSIISAFHIGWRDLNIGWVRMALVDTKVGLKF